VIERYTRPEMGRIWEPENRFRIWLTIEILAMEAMVRDGLIPADALVRVKKNAKFDIPRIDEIEKRVKHDVIAFLTSVAEHVGDDSRFLHVGMTRPSRSSSGMRKRSSRFSRDVHLSTRPR
jgi:adenylosuccinate lyase